jgi:hypothetical protein
VKTTEHSIHLDCEPSNFNRWYVERGARPSGDFLHIIASPDAQHGIDRIQINVYGTPEQIDDQLKELILSASVARVQWAHKHSPEANAAIYEAEELLGREHAAS